MDQKQYEKAYSFVYKDNYQIGKEEALQKLIEYENGVQRKKTTSSFAMKAVTRAQEKVNEKYKDAKNLPLDAQYEITEVADMMRKTQQRIALDDLQEEKIKLLEAYYQTGNGMESFNGMQELLRSEATLRKKMLAGDVKSQNFLNKMRTQIAGKKPMNIEIMTRDQEVLQGLPVEEALSLLSAEQILHPDILSCYALDLVQIVLEKEKRNEQNKARN